MALADLLRETLDVGCNEVWENERTPTPVRVFGVRLHPMGLSVREVAAVLELLGNKQSHGAVWNWTHDLAEAQEDPPTAEPSRVAVDGKDKWLYAAVDTESESLLEVDGGGYLTALFRYELSGQLNYRERYYIEKWFQTVSMRIDRFHSFWRDS